MRRGLIVGLGWGAPAASGILAARWATSDPFDPLVAPVDLAIFAAGLALVAAAAGEKQRARAAATSIALVTLGLWLPGVLRSGVTAQAIALTAAALAGGYAGYQLWRRPPQGSGGAGAPGPSVGSWGWTLGCAFAAGLILSRASGFAHLVVPATIAALGRRGVPRDGSARGSAAAWIVAWIAMSLVPFPTSPRRGFSAPETAGRPGPSAIVVVLDTLRRDRLSLYGYERETTPSIDRWSRQALVFDSAASTSPWTLPSHASLFTGLFPRAHGAHGFRGDRKFGNAHPLAPEYRTIAEEARAAGVLTGAVVANHFYLSRYFGLDQGFDSYWVARPQRGIAFAPGDWLASKLRPQHLWREQRAYYAASHITDLALDWLESAEDRAFFLFVNYLDVHEPNARPPSALVPRDDPETALDPDEDLALVSGQPLAEEKERWLRNHYDRELEELDRQVGRLLAYVEESGLAERTTVFLTSDHGEYLGEHGLVDHSLHLHRQVIDIPLIVRGPGVRPGRSAQPVQLVDLFPSVLESLSLPQPAASSADRGVSIFGPGREEMVAEWYPSASPLRRSPTLVERFDRSIRALQLGPYKLFADERGLVELYDLAADPGEEHDIADESPAARDELNERLRTWLERNPPAVRENSPAPALDDEALEQLRALGYAS